MCVHGTFAGHAEDEGGKWWQLGSDFAAVLRRFMPRGVRAAEGDEVFHWSGQNSERARTQAASELVEHLKRQERDGKSYHLVGHSHGGSVIWHALKLATQMKIPLIGLRSWTTIGTPFLHHRRRSVFSSTSL